MLVGMIFALAGAPATAASPGTATSSLAATSTAGPTVAVTAGHAGGDYC